ncbi:MAG: alginate lyase family protein [Chitinophagaceae bacterium]
MHQQIIKNADWAMQQQPVTVTAAYCTRSAGGRHDFYSEGDYWWPSPLSADSPYIQKDGQTNPDNFGVHRLAMIRFSKIMGALASAWLITKEEKYAAHARLHCNAWFSDTATSMNASLLYAQAIKGRYTGRGIGIIDAIQLMEVAQAILVFQLGGTDKDIFLTSKQWFSKFVGWLTTHPYGKDEMNATNNHGTCWVMQVSVFAKLMGNDSLLEFCRTRYKKVLLPNQMAADGSFPQELKRTKAYGYSIFNLDAMSTICQLLSTKKDNLWTYQTADGRSIKKGIEYMYPFVANKTNWPMKPDVMYWDNWPVAQPFLIFGAQAFNNRAWFETWKTLDHEPRVEEVIRNLPVRNPLIWLE